MAESVGLGESANEECGCRSGSTTSTKCIAAASIGTVRALARQGVKSLVVMMPGFAADCLETLEEIAMENAEGFKRHGGPLIVFQVGPDAGQDELKGCARSFHQRQALDQGPQVSGGGIQRNQDQVGQGKQVGIDSADGGRGVDKQIRSTGVTEGVYLRRELG